MVGAMVMSRFLQNTNAEKRDAIKLVHRYRRQAHARPHSAVGFMTIILGYVILTPTNDPFYIRQLATHHTDDPLTQRNEPFV